MLCRVKNVSSIEGFCISKGRALLWQVASRRVQNAKSDRFHENIHRRGKVASGVDKIVSLSIQEQTLVACLRQLLNSFKLLQRNKDKGLSVGPVLLGFFLFVVVGSGRRDHALYCCYMLLLKIINSCTQQQYCCSTATNHPDSDRRQQHFPLSLELRASSVLCL